ncbi:hypothetical protein GCM10011391_38330 [Pullulanibacillus camelliae]|uniref:Aspartyl-phosphate phosphatase Spo0E family protein n=1 Tax=Pullulanibacillus camelliae TaxID=1707096 RepID=A0A8J3E218_9BACL|nr:aspartyl-phosphate phosphatase Spo0E family protein [Pullulanibacillus camelliae]GGE55672.1 hypothetical protein GCM10011391_38330 [Pullulanibacillus camelliae]
MKNQAKAIEATRLALYKLADKKSLTSPDIIKQSQKLDRLLNRHILNKNKAI